MDAEWGGNMMRSTSTWMTVLVGAMLATAAGAASPLSPASLVSLPDGTRLYVAAETAARILEVDPTAGSVSKEIKLDAPAAGITLSPDGTRIFAVGGVGRGRAWCIDGARGRELWDAPAGHSPVAPTVSKDGTRLYICDRFPGRVLVLDASNGKQISSIPLVREPIACALTSEGATLVVVNHLPDGPATADVVSIAVSLVDTASGAATHIRLPNGCTAGRGVCLSTDGKFAYVTSILGRYTLPTTQLDRGWMMTSALSVIDVVQRKLVNTVLLDEIDRGAANPWGVACTPDGARLLVTHSGSHEVSVIDRVKLHDKLDRVAKGEKVTAVSTSPQQVPNDLAFLVDIRERVRLPGNGPRGVAVIGSRACVTEYFTDTLAVFDPSASPVRCTSIPLGPKPAPDAIPQGEIFFHDSALCFQQWQSCASCHPDARVDGLNWDLLNDGLGNPKNTKNMLLSHETPPAMSMGVRETAEDAVRAGIRHIQFLVRPEEDAVAIDVYLKSLRPGLSPHRKGKDLSAAAQRGEQIFQRAGCAECHPPPLYTDMRHHDVGIGSGREQGKPMDTPTLIESWRTAPYLHDGRAATMLEVLREANPDDRHGRTSGLTPLELSDLAEYVLSL